MAELFGVIAAGITVGGELIKFGRAIQKSIKRIKNARKDAEGLASETIIFAGVYQRFLRTCNDESNISTTDALARHHLITWAQGTAMSLATLLEKVEALRPHSKARFGFEDKAIAHLIWHGSANTIKALRVSLRIARESINCFSNLMRLEQLKRLLETIKEALNGTSKRRDLEMKLGVALEAKFHDINQEM